MDNIEKLKELLYQVFIILCWLFVFVFLISLIVGLLYVIFTVFCFGVGIVISLAIIVFIIKVFTG